jgi:transketolase
MTDKELKEKSIHYRKKMLTYIKHANAGHTGGSLSCVDILNVLYNRILNVTPQNFMDINRNHYIQSKGHSVESLYVVLADKGFFPESDLETLCGHGSHYVGHPTRKVNGIEHNSGALGHGLSFCVGMALAEKMDGRENKIFTLLGDGELAEGSNWEALMAASHYKLDNLTAILDYNKLQITGWIKDVMSSEPLEQKFSSFGASVRQVDGHDIKALTEVISSVPFENEKPSVIIANTIKGKGISFIENNYKWHHHVPSDAEFEQAMMELDQALLQVNNN